MLFITLSSLRTIHDLCDDLTDSGVYAIVMSQLVPERCLQQQLRAIFDLSLTDDDVDLLQVKIKRAELVLENSRTLGCPYDISAEDMASGQPHVHLLMATFLFNSFLGIRDLPEEDEVKCRLGMRVTLTMNSLT